MALNDLLEKYKQLLTPTNVGKLSQTISAPFRTGGEFFGKPIAQSLKPSVNFFNPSSNAGKNFWSTKPAQKIANFQNKIQSPEPTTIVPTFTPFKGGGVGSQLGNIATNFPGGLVNSIVGKGIIDPGLDLGTNLGRIATGQTATPYSQVKAPQTRFGYQLAGKLAPNQVTTNPQYGFKEVAGNIGGTVAPIIDAYFGKGALGFGKKALEGTIKDSIWTITKKAFARGSIEAGAGGFAHALSDNRLNDDDVSYVSNIILTTTVSSLLGGGLSGGMAFGGRSLGNLGRSEVGQVVGRKATEIIGDVKNTIRLYGDTPVSYWVGNERVTTPMWKYKLWEKYGISPTGKQSGKADLNYKFNDTQPKKGRVELSGQQKIESPMEPNPQIDQPISARTRIEPVDISKTLETPQSQLPSSDILPQGKIRGLVRSVQETPNVSASTKKVTSGTYTPKTDDKLMGEAKALLSESGSIKSIDKVKNIDQKVAATIQEALNLDAAGKHAEAANLFNNLSEAGTELGRGVHAFSLLDRMSPEAIALSAAAKIKKYNQTAIRKIPELAGSQVKMISKMVEKIRKMKPGREKNIAINELSNTVNDFVPSGIADKFITTWKAGLLTSLRTHERNLLGNTIMGAAEVVKDLPATGADILMSQRTGTRTLSPTLRGLREIGTKSTRQQVTDIVTKGYDPELDIGKFDVRRINWGNNPIEQSLKKYTDAVFRALESADKPFYNAAFKRSLYDQAQTAAINAGKQGDSSFIKKLVNKPTQEMLTTAVADSQYATFHDKNALSKLAGAVKRWSNENWYTKLPAEIVAPFTGVPSSIVGKTFDYSPLGLIRGAVDFGRVMTGNVPNLQRRAAQEIGRGIVGTGLFGLGAYLMDKGLMTGQPKDTKEAQLWQAQGKQSNSVLVGGKWRSINSIGPQNLIVLAGAKYQEEMSDPEGSFGNYAFGLGKDQLSQTFLSGVQQPLNALTDPARYGKSYVGNQLASVTPNIVKDASKAIDPYARETNTVMDYMKSTIPGVRNSLLPKRDVLGNMVKQEPTGLNAFFDLFNSKTPISNATVDELHRLYEVGNEATPSKLTQNQTLLKQKVKLTFEQLDKLEAGVGEKLRPQLEALITSPTYQELDDEHKAKAIDKLVQDVRTKYKNINASDLTSGEVTSDIEPSKTGGYSYSYVDEEGNYKTIDLNEIPEPPVLTGNSELDKKAISKYKGKLTSLGNDVFKLYELGQITAEQANSILQSLVAESKRISASTGGSKKKAVVKLNIPKFKGFKQAKTKVTRISEGRTIKIKPRIKLASKAPKIDKKTLKVVRV